MGGAVSSGRNNKELIDNLKASNYIRTRDVELAFRAVDRGDYLLPEVRHQAYKDLAWRSGPLHMSAPCIYSEVMENLELHRNQSFLNVGSGTGYLSTMAGLILGSGGINHGIEIYPMVVDYANKKLKEFLEESHALNEFDFAEPKFFVGNGLCLAPLQAAYDRVYCGAGCPEEYQNYFKQLIRVGGLLVMPLNNNLVQMRRVADAEWTSRNVLNVSFATFRVPADSDARELLKIDDLTPPQLQTLSRGAVRAAIRQHIVSSRPDLAPPISIPAAPRIYPRRICIPIDDDSDAEDLNALHDLNRESGANEMNALLNLVLSMGSNHVAGAIRFDTFDTADDSSDDDDDGNHQQQQGHGIQRRVVPLYYSDSNPTSSDEEMKNEDNNTNSQVNQPSQSAKTNQSNDQANQENNNSTPSKAADIINTLPETNHSKMNGNSDAGSSKLGSEIRLELEEPKDESPSQSNQSSSQPNQSSSQSNQSSPQPNQSSGEPNQSNAQLNQSTPQSNQSSPQPNLSSSQPNQSTPQPNQSTSQSNQNNRNYVMSELCNRTIYRALTGHDRPANDNESARGRLSLTVEYNDPSDTSTENEVQPSTSSKKQDRKRHSQTSLNTLQEPDSAKMESDDKMESDLSDEGLVEEDSAAKGEGKAKRKKFDSGIGEESTPSTSSHSPKEESKDPRGEASSERSRFDDYDDSANSAASTTSDDKSAVPLPYQRRIELTYLTTEAIRALPLPPALKRYVNMHRDLNE